MSSVATKPVAPAITSFIVGTLFDGYLFSRLGGEIVRNRREDSQCAFQLHTVFKWDICS